MILCVTWYTCLAVNWYILRLDILDKLSYIKYIWTNERGPESSEHVTLLHPKILGYA